MDGRNAARIEPVSREAQRRTIAVLEAGVTKVEDALGLENLYEHVHTPLVHHLQNALRAKELFHRDKDYLVDAGEVKIIDEFKAFAVKGNALDLAVVHSQAYWERELLANVGNKAFNSRIAEIALRGQFPADYKETREQKIDVKADVVVDFSSAVNDLISKLKEAK